MLKTVLVGTLALVAGSAVMVRADAKDDVTGAANKLADANSYSWTTASEGANGPGGGGVDGKTEKDGYTSLTMHFGDNTREMIRKGEKVVIHTDDGWQTPEEMAAARGNDQNNQGQGRRRGRGRGMGNFTLPADEIKRLADSTKGLQQSGDVISGDMSEDGVKQFMMFGRRGRRGGNAQGQGNGPEISNAKGTVKFWVDNGNINKVEYHVTGTVSFNGNDRDIDRTTTITIKDVGSTKVEVPEDAKKKLEG